MSDKGKRYDYPLFPRVFYSVFGIPFSVVMIVLAAYAIAIEGHESFPQLFVTIGGALFFLALLVGALFNYYQLGTVIVNDREIISLKRIGTVSIPWQDVHEIFYIIGRGRNDPLDPFFTVYIFSKNKDFIIVNRHINGIQELMGTIRQYLDTSHVKHLTSRELIMMFLRLYMSARKKVLP